MDDREIALRVAARHQRTILARGWEGKIVGRDFRLQWNDDQWFLEELPQKGKKKLRVATHDNLGSRYHYPANLSVYIAANIMHHAGVSPSDSYDHVKNKIGTALQAAAEATIAKAGDKDWSFLRTSSWNERLVYFTEIMPEGMESFNAEGQDFVVKVEWTSFSAYSPESDFQQADPHYTLYEASSPGAARKFYQILKENPNAIRHIPWDKFSEWLNHNKIGYKTHFSQWH